MIGVQALLLTGVFGAGKSAVAEEIANVLEAGGCRFAAIDLDWLCWSNAPGAGHDEHEILVRNLAAVAAIYRGAGVQRFVLAGAVPDSATLDALRAAMAAPVLVVRLTAPLPVVEERLAGSSAHGRSDDLVRARAWLAAGMGVGLEDAIVENVGPVREATLRILEIAGWGGGDAVSTPPRMASINP